jgi:hypothetical protein
MSDELIEELRADAVRQIAAGAALIRESSLMTIEFDGRPKFRHVQMAMFEQASRDVHPRFGRVMNWIWFSTGAEYLLKGVLISTRDFAPQPSAPKLDVPLEEDFEAWVSDAFKRARKSRRSDYGTLTGMQKGLKALCGRHLREVTEVRRGEWLRAAFQLLAESVRNRDAHAYVPDERIQHFHLVRMFEPAFNTLLAWAPAAVVRDALAQAEKPKHS